MRFSSMSAAVLLVAGIGLVGCVAETGGSEVDDATAAAPTLKANVPGFTVWVEQGLRRDHRYDADVWVARGRTSKNLDSAFSFASDDEYGEALVVSPRVFEFTVDNVSAEQLLAGMRLFVTLQVTGDATPYYASLTFAPALGTFTGSSKIFVHDDVTPVLVAGGLRFRGVASVVNGVSAFSVNGPLAPADAVQAISARTYQFDFLGDPFMDQAHAATPIVRFGGTAGGAAIEKDATIALQVATLGLVHGGSVYDAFPEPACSSKVKSCVVNIAAGQQDTGVCGTAKQIKTCFVSVPSPPGFATDLQNALGPWYQQHGADATGGNTLQQAIAAVDAKQVVELTAAADDPQGHDLSKYRVLSHPDVVFPGSDRRWFGAYARADGSLEAVYDFE